MFADRGSVDSAGRLLPLCFLPFLFVRVVVVILVVLLVRVVVVVVVIVVAVVVVVAAAAAAVVAFSIRHSVISFTGLAR